MKHEGEFERFTHAGRTVVLCFDPEASSPRDNDGNLATIACWHQQVDLGDRKLSPADGADWRDRKATVAALEAGGDKVLAILPVWIYQHSGIFLRAAAERPGYPFDCKWDAGQVGWAYVLKSTALKVGCKPGKRWSYVNGAGERRSGAYNEAYFVEAIMQEVDVYDRWGRGEFAGYIVEDEDGDQLDSCWGFDDVDYCRQEAKNAAESVRSLGETDSACDQRCSP